MRMLARRDAAVVAPGTWNRMSLSVFVTFVAAVAIARIAALHPALRCTGLTKIFTKCLGSDRRFSKWQAPSKLVPLRSRQYGQRQKGHCL